MASIEERVVGMRFDSSKFQSGIKPAIDGLDQLKQSLKLDGATKAIDELDAAGSRFSLASVANAAEGVSNRFIAMATVGITALTNIVNKAINAGESIVKSLTIDPVKAGLDEYELTMGSIQTILANTSKYGTSLKDVTDSLSELNTYADKTIYNFGDMTKNIGLFTNAGLRIEEATSLIKGFSNSAAASGTTAAAAAGAAYQLSQALSAGTIRLMDWRSLTNAGMGNKNMQAGLIEIAQAMGTFSNGTATAVSAGKDFNGSLEQNWLSAGVMSNYLKIMAGDMDEATMKSLGLSDATIATFKQQQKTAEEAATKVRTWTQLIGTMREAVGSGWSQSFSIIIGDFEEATQLFTNVNNVMGSLIGAASDARNKLLQDWSDNGGRAAGINAIASAFNSLMKILGVVKDAFLEVFPAATGKDIADITKAIYIFINGLKPGEKALADIKSTAKGFFALLSIGAMVISNFVKMITGLLGYVGTGAGGFLEFTGNIGDFIVKMEQAIKKGEGITKFFEGLGKVLHIVLGVLGFVVGSVFDLFNNLDQISSSGIGSWIEDMQARLKPLATFVGAIGGALGFLRDVAIVVAKFFAPLAQSIGNLFKGLSGAIADSFSTGNFDTTLRFINTALLGGIVGLVWKFIGTLKGVLENVGPGSGIMASIKGVFGQLGETLKVFQGQIKANTLLTIAAAVGILTLSIIGLSLIDPVKLGAALAAISVMFAQLIAVMAIMDKAFAKTTLADAGKMAIITASMAGLAFAMLLFSASIAILGSMSWEDLAKGLVGLAGALAIMSGAMLLMSKVGPGAILGSVALVIASAGILVLAGALKLLGTLSWDDIGRGMVALGASLAILAVGLTLMMGSIPGAAALVIASVGILVIAAALKIFATLSWDDIGRAMATLGATLAILAVGLTLMLYALPGAAALVIASVGLAVIAGVLKIFATLSWDDIGRAMTTLGATLAILAVGLTLMVAALPGAAALLVASVALTVLAGVLAVLGALGWDVIGTGLGAMAAALGILALAGILLIPAIPGLIGLGIAIAFLGVGVLAAGVGIAALAIGLTALSVAGGAAIVTLVAAVSGLASLIPYVAEQIGIGILMIATVISNGGPQILAALTTILLALIAAIVAIVPPLVDAIVLLVTKLVEALVVLIPLLVDAGLRLITGILDGFAKNIGKVIEKGTDLIVALLEGVGKAIPRLLQAGAQLVLDFLNGIATTIRNNSAKFQEAGGNIASAIIDGMTGGISRGVSSVISAITNVAQGAINAAKAALGIRSPSREFAAIGAFSTQGLANGIIATSKVSEKAAGTLGKNTLSALQKSMAKAGNTMTIGLDTNPTIRPVLDLSQVKKDAGLIGGIVNGQTLAVDGATARANEIAVKYGEYQMAVADANGPTTEVNMTQNVYSPKAVPAAEVYRQTNNQMSILKGELNK